jgi:hypothetical protein
MATIHELLPRVAASIGAVAKTRQNQAQNYSFRGIDDFLNAVHGALTEHEVSLLPHVAEHRVEFRARDRGVTTHVFLTMEYTFAAPDGSSVVVSTVGEAADTSDKATNKAMSAALKYAILQTFTVPTLDIADSDRDTPDMGDRPYDEVLVITADEADDLKVAFNAITDDDARKQAKKDFVAEMGSLSQLPASRIREAQQWIEERVAKYRATTEQDGTKEPAP